MDDDPDVPTNDLTADIAEVLDGVLRPGDFYVSGPFDLLPPGIEIEGFGPLALPVLPDQAARLIAAASPAPFGRGQKTLIDKSVRRSWQIAPDRIRIAGKRWPATLDAVVARAALGLGVEDGVEAEFYKVLVYEAGDFFVSHRDTEKSPGMFATLLVTLPSVSTGGDLVVRHQDREARLDLRGSDPSEARFAAFYADCVHEVLPVESGCRVTLVYNLIRRGKGKRIEPPSYGPEEEKLAALLTAWEAAAVGPDGAGPAKVVYVLDHAYTPAEMSFAALKGADAAAAGVLAGAAARADCELHLALLTIEESGWAEYNGRGRSSRGRWRDFNSDDADDYQIGDIDDRSRTLSDWRRPDGSPGGLGEMSVEDDEFSPPEALNDLTPDEQHLHEATGNEGATLERTYRRAALVVWPRAAFMPMLASAGLNVSLPYLGDLAARSRNGSPDERNRLAAQARALAQVMIGHWQAQRHHDGGATTSTTIFLDHLVAIDAGQCITHFLMRPDDGAARSQADNRAVIEALTILPPSDRASILDHLIGQSGSRRFATGADLLARSVRAWTDLSPAALVAPARRLLTVCPRDATPLTGYPDRPPDAKSVAAFLGALVRIDSGLADDAAGLLLRSRKTFEMDAHLVPAARDLAGDRALAEAPAIMKLRRACVAHLEARIALPLAPPADYRRDKSLTCRCVHCGALAQFLDDPAAPSWTFKAIQSDRSHVESTILNCHPDVVTETVRKGSPHQLVVTKNQASYERRVKQRREDLDNLKVIDSAVA